LKTGGRLSKKKEGKKHIRKQKNIKRVFNLAQHYLSLTDI
jgi:hypothetical protein